MSFQLQIEGGQAAWMGQLNKVANKEQVGRRENESVWDSAWPAIVEKFLDSCPLM
ncbi:MAG: hypothetical protein ACI4QS_07560 [Comamonas sp.]